VGVQTIEAERQGSARSHQIEFRVHGQQLLENFDSGNLQSLFQESPQFFCVISGPDLRFEYVNAAHRAIFNGEDLTGRTVEEAQPELRGSGFIDLLFTVLKTGNPVTFYEHPAMVRMEERFFDLTFAPRRNREGKVDGILALGMDVTERVRIRQNLELREADLRQALSARDTFLGIASHELKTPLTSLKLQNDMNRLMLERQGLDFFTAEKLSKIFQNSIEQSQRLTRLVDDMLDISSIGAGKLAMNLLRTNLTRVVRETFERFLPQCLEVGSRLDFELAEGMFLSLDAHRFEQVLTNLITNAIRYAPGHPIHVQLYQDGVHAILKVTDRGPGIAPENQERIFDRFERVTPAAGLSGLGLGLYISKQIIEAHSGRINVESELGNGACFVIKVPLDRV